MTIRILTVCTGNICRSPLAAQLLASRLDPTVFEIESAGISAMVGGRMPEAMHSIATRLGINDTEHHRAVALNASAVTAADLILGMDREHRRRAAQVQPTAVRRAFTLIEFAHIVSSIDSKHLTKLVRNTDDIQRAALEAVMRMRGVAPRLNPERRYDVEDPYGRSRQTYERSAKQIERAVEDIVAFFQRTAELATATTPRNGAYSRWNV